MQGKGYSKGIESTKMQDGTEAWLTPSKRYYCRAEPSYEERTSIAYYGLDKERIPLAKGICNQCNEVIESKMCGDFQSCKCKKSFVDTDRQMPERHRYGGDIEQL